MKRPSPFSLSPRLGAGMRAAFLWLVLPAAVSLMPNVAGAQAAPQATDAATAVSVGGPVRLRQPVQATAVAPVERQVADATQTPYRPGEFEVYVQSLAGKQAEEIRRFGTELGLASGDQGAASEFAPQIPPDYIIQAGDELILTIWGSVDADLRLQVDRSGRIALPRVGPVLVAGTRYSDLSDVISRRIALAFKNYQLSVALGQLRGMRVYVTGFVHKPGAQVVSSLSTLAQAVMKAGGPSNAGSFRNVQLRRGGAVIANFDLYELLVNGNRNADKLLQSDDVIHVGPVGPQVAVIGSVNRPAIFEIKAGETLADIMAMAGGFAPVADVSRVAIERMDARATVKVTQLDARDIQQTTLKSGDIVRAFNAVTIALPVERQNKRVRVEGEVALPGELVLPPTTTLREAVQRAGGLTSAAFLYGSVFTRESVRETQQQNYDRMLRDLEMQLSRSEASKKVSTTEDAALQTTAAQNSSRFLERLRAARPSGRVVLQIAAAGGELPELTLEDGDRLYIPPRPTAVGVAGSVYNAGSYLYIKNRTVGDYLRLAGGPTRGADEGSMFIVRADGSVQSGQKATGWFGGKDSIQSLSIGPGDTVFVPEEMNKTTFVQSAKDWTQILYQLGIGIAGIKSAVK